MMKKFGFSGFLTCLLILGMATLVLAEEVTYTFDDWGEIQNTRIELNAGEWFSRPGLDTFPDPVLPQNFTVEADLINGGIDQVILTHRPPGGEFEFPTNTVEGTIESGVMTAQFEPNLEGLNYCMPQWDYAFYLQGFQGGLWVETDERHYDDGSGGGDPYVFTLLNPDPNQAPVAEPGGPYIVNRFETEFVTLDASGSFDPEGFGLTYEWDVYVTWPDYQPSPYEWDDEFDDGTGVSVDVPFEEAGFYHVRLKVTDECGEEAVAETYFMVYDPHIVVVPQDNHIAGLNWHQDMLVSLYIDGEFIDAKMVEGPEEGLPEKDGYMTGFQLDHYGIGEIFPGQLVTLIGEVGETTVVREHVVRGFSVNVDYENDVVFGDSELRMPVPPEENYVRVRIEEPEHLEIVAWADEGDGTWSADFGAEGIDLVEEIMVSVLQQNYYDSSHTMRYLPEDGGQEEFHPRFIIQPDHGWAFGMEWPLETMVTLTIDDDMDPSNGFILQQTLPTFQEGENPFGVVQFEFWEMADQVQPGHYVTMMDGETFKDTIIASMAFESLDAATETAAGYGPPARPGHVFIMSNDMGYGREITSDAAGNWMADFSGEGIDFSAVQDANVELWDDDGDGTMAHLQLESWFLGGAILPNPVAVGEEVTIHAFYQQGYLPIDVMEISFFQNDPPAWIAQEISVEDGFATGSTTISFDEPGVYPVGSRAFTAQGQEMGGFIGFVVVYDPDGGFVTGGGWIYSPPGAYFPDPALEGTATFGFVSKYKKGASVPTGQTEFQFRVADLNFHSTAYDWLVVAGAKAMYKGVGTINGEGEYKFMISAIDGDLKTGEEDGIDRFRIRIWEEVDGMEVVIYDNQLGDWPEADPATALGGGSIVIHKSK